MQVDCPSRPDAVDYGRILEDIWVLHKNKKCAYKLEQ